MGVGRDRDVPGAARVAHGVAHAVGQRAHEQIRRGAHFQIRGDIHASPDLRAASRATASRASSASGTDGNASTVFRRRNPAFVNDNKSCTSAEMWRTSSKALTRIRVARVVFSSGESCGVRGCSTPLPARASGESNSWAVSPRKRF